MASPRGLFLALGVALECNYNVESESHSDDVLAVKDGAAEHSIPTAWRNALREIVTAIAAGDYGLEKAIVGVEPVSARTASQIQNYVKEYNATLASLPDAAWSTSTCMWYGKHWDALVDLWTLEEGPSDLVLHIRVAEAEQGFSINIQSVHVP